MHSNDKTEQLDILQELDLLRERNAELEQLCKETAKALKKAEDKNLRLEEHLFLLEESLNLVLNSNGHRLLNKYYNLAGKIKILHSRSV
jgi:hypothetical protein